MKALIILLWVLVFAAGGVSGASSPPFGFTAESVARVQIEDWSQPGHPYAEFIKLDGAWVQLAVGTDGFTALPTNARVDDLVSAILSLPLGAFQLDTPDGLDLNSRDNTMTPVHFCAVLTTVTRDYRAVCSDEDSSGQLWASVYDSVAHLRGYYALADDQAVLEAMRNL